MTTKINILHIEDNPDDSVLIERVLRRGGYNVFLKRVETAEELEQEITKTPWDVILSDFDLPHYNGIAALEFVKAQKVEAPFILVSGAVGETVAVAMMRKGALDYVMKDNLSRLVPVLNRELVESENRRKAMQADQAMQSIVKSIVGTTGKDSFKKILHGLCRWAGARSGLIGMVENDSIHTLFSLNGLEKTKSFHFKIEGTPCGQVMEKGFLLFPENVSALFPKDRRLVENGVESYVGIPLQDSEKNVIGILAIYSGQQMKVMIRLKNYMEIVAAKAASEIERLKSEKEKRSLEEQLHQSQKMESIGTLTGGIAHDFNNIMGIIVGNTELALEDVPKKSSVYDNLQEIKNAGLRAASIVKQLLSFSRKTPHELQKIEVVPIIKETLKLLKSTIPSTISIHSAFLADRGTILADPVQINQIIINLCINASHAMEISGGILKITIENVDLSDKKDPDYPEIAKRKYIKIVVSDTGSGINPLIIDRIFDPYFTTKALGKGSGMGLAVVHGIVKNHNGNIFVQSEFGEGTRFTIFFPLVEGQASVEAEVTTEILLGDETILLVDDEISIINMARLILERLGYRVETRTNPQEALDLFQKKSDHFDLVMTDMSMPQMNGLDLYKKVKEVRRDIPVLLCTGHSSLVDEDIASSLGISGYVMKPFSKVGLARIIRNVLDRKNV